MIIGLRTLSSLWASASRFVRGMIRPPEGKRHVLANFKERDRRMSICLVCPELVADSKQCRSCTCFVALKTMLNHERCPLRRW